MLSFCFCAVAKASDCSGLVTWSKCSCFIGLIYIIVCVLFLRSAIVGVVIQTRGGGEGGGRVCFWTFFTQKIAITGHKTVTILSNLAFLSDSAANVCQI